MNSIRPERSFERILASLERDLLEASDEEILAVANELGIKPGMKGSLALFGVYRRGAVWEADSESATSESSGEYGSSIEKSARTERGYAAIHVSACDRRSAPVVAIR